MDNCIRELRRMILEKEHFTYRKTVDEIAENFEKENLTPIERMTKRLCYILKAETPVVLKDERISYMRTVENIPAIFTENEMKTKFAELDPWAVANICPDYATTIKSGLIFQKERCQKRMETANDEQKLFLGCVIQSIEEVIQLARRYREEALRVGNDTVADILSRIPEQGAQTFHEALQFFRILHFTLWCEGENHNGIGRFDQYMYPYWKRDIESGTLSEEEAFSLLEEFFTTFNRDHDLYPGVQKGDNGQSMMLGGVDKDGNHCFNELSSACLKASCELTMIDPKINLRVDKDTPIEILNQGTELTKKGLGFPQYANDDIVIPGLVDLGYSLTDARDYTVAACWEFIIPRYGMDIPNVKAFHYPDAVDRCVSRLDTYDTYDEFMIDIKKEMSAITNEVIRSNDNIVLLPAPFMSLLMDDCIDNAADISQGARYNNYGIHGAGLSTAVDAITSVKLHVFDEKTVSAKDMMSAVETDFATDEDLLSLLRYNTPKFGDMDETSNNIACELIDFYAECLLNKKNNRGGIFRPGTGSAMYYMWYTERAKASAGGHRKSEPLETNYAPALYVRSKGPLSVIQSFTKPDLRKVINGGPLTMEFHSNVFRDEDSIEKISYLIKCFILNGGHQLQLNAVNSDTMLDAQLHPEQHQDLIVRVWGWSAYFIQLDKSYQDHVIARQEYTLG